MTSRDVLCPEEDFLIAGPCRLYNYYISGPQADEVHDYVAIIPTSLVCDYFTSQSWTVFAGTEAVVFFENT
jgi:hypothetical protein